MAHIKEYCDSDDTLAEVSGAKVFDATNRFVRVEHGIPEDVTVLVDAFRTGTERAYIDAEGTRTVRQVLVDALAMLDPATCQDPISVQMTLINPAEPSTPAHQVGPARRRLAAELSVTP